MTDFSPQVPPVVPVTNIRYGQAGSWAAPSGGSHQGLGSYVPPGAQREAGWLMLMKCIQKDLCHLFRPEPGVAIH